MALSHGLYLYLNPYDEVAIEVRDVPADTRFLCLVADRPDGLALMPWAIRKVFPSTMHPDSCNASYRSEGEAGPHRGGVRWVRAERVGVLLQAMSGRWRIAWFGAADSRVLDGSLLFGGGTWRPSLLAAESEQPLAEGELRALGLDYALEKEK